VQGVGDAIDDIALATLIARSRRAPEEFAGVVRALSAPLHAYLSRRAPREADDLLAEAWLQAFRSRERFDPALGTPRAWAFGVARHVLLAHLRTRPDVASGGHVPEQASDPWPEVDDRLAASAAGPALRSALAALPAVERELLLLVAWEGLSPTEAAAVVAVPAGTARTRLFRARARLRESLDPRAAGVPLPEVAT
jgi:RNA polymerase sigma-70 factor (ECF subfamily)